jgi:hypothetical protein
VTLRRGPPGKTIGWYNANEPLTTVAGRRAARDPFDSSGRSARRALKRYYFEDVVDPERFRSRVCDFLGLSSDHTTARHSVRGDNLFLHRELACKQDALGPIDESRPMVLRERLSGEQIATVEAISGNLVRTFGISADEQDVGEDEPESRPNRGPRSRQLGPLAARRASSVALRSAHSAHFACAPIQASQESLDERAARFPQVGLSWVGMGRRAGWRRMGPDPQIRAVE